MRVHKFVGIVEESYGVVMYSRVLVRLELGPLHDEQPGQDVDEDPLHPRRHLVRLRRPEVHVQHHHRHRDATCIKKKKKNKAD